MPLYEKYGIALGLAFLCQTCFTFQWLMTKNKIGSIHQKKKKKRERENINKIKLLT